MEKNNTTNYLLFIILFTIILFIFTNKCKKTNEKFNNIDIKNYIEDNTEKLLNEKLEHDFNSTKEELKTLPEYKNGIKSRDLKHKMEKFNNRLNELSNVNIEENKEIEKDINTFINSINETDKDIYNDFILEYYNEHDNKIFDKIQNYEDSFNKVQTHEDFVNTNETTRNNDIDLETIMGKYFVLPYQYKEFNNVYMILTKKVNLDRNEDEGYVLGFYVLDELVCDFEVELEKKHENLLNLKEKSKSEDLSKNILGYEIFIKQENPNNTFEFKYPKYREGVKNMLKNLGFSKNMKVYIFMVDNQFNKQYLNIDGEINGISQDEYFHTDSDDLFRIYSKNGATLLHLSKKNTIDKPFQSLVA